MPPSRTASIYYHTPNYLSSTKLKVFQLFLIYYERLTTALQSYRRGYLPEPCHPERPKGVEGSSYRSLHYILLNTSRKTAHFRVRHMFTLSIFPDRPRIATGVQRRKGLWRLPLRNMPTACFRQKKPRPFGQGCMLALSSFWVGQVLSRRPEQSGGLFQA